MASTPLGLDLKKSKEQKIVSERSSSQNASLTVAVIGAGMAGITASALHGAYHSGLRASNQIVAATSKKKSVLPKELDSKSSKEAGMQMNVKEIPFSDAVVVLGGGISGLFATRELSRRGHKVVLIEAQNRLGGRVYPVEIEGVELQLGATYMHDTGTVKTSICLFLN